jgi:hypothetical protein
LKIVEVYKMFSINDDCNKQPLSGYKSHTKLHIKFNKIVNLFNKREFKLSDVSPLCDKLNVLLQYDPNKIQLVLKHDSEIQKHYIHYIQHAFCNKQYKLLLYFFNNSHLYLKDLDYIVRVINDYHMYLVKVYKNMFSSNVLLNIVQKKPGINQQRFMDMTELMVNIRKHKEGYVNNPNLSGNMYFYLYGDIRDNLEIKKIIDRYISSFNCFQIWILSKILKKHDNDLLDLKKMIHYIFPDMKEPFMEIDINMNNLDDRPLAYYVVNNAQTANVYNNYTYANVNANINVITTTNTITNYATRNTYYTNPVNYTYTGYLP